MRYPALSAVVSLLVSLSAVPASGSSPSVDYGKIPMAFEENRGQTDPRVLFLSRGRGYALFLTSTEAVLSLRDGTAAADVVRMQIVGGSEKARIRGIGPLPGVSNYLIGREKENWRTNIPNYARVRYEEVYPGIDLVYYGNGEKLEYDFVVQPGADPRQIAMRFRGTQRIRIDDGGDLLLTLPAREVRLQAPILYQEVAGTRKEVVGRFALRGRDRVSFDIGAFDRARPLVIDPTLIYSTYAGGARGDEAFDLAVDAAGNAYIAGITASVDFPQAGTQLKPPPTLNQTDAFVTKLNPSGTSFVFSTYIGSDSTADTAMGIGVALDGSVWITGDTGPGLNYPTTPTAFQPSPSSSFGGHGFVTKLNATGSAILYSSFMDGSNVDEGWAVVIDAAGIAYVAGRTASPNFPITPALACQPIQGGFFDAFLLKIDSTLSGAASLVYGTFFGGSINEGGDALAVDRTGIAYITGDVQSLNYPVKNGFQTSKAPGRDAHLVKIDPSVSGPAGWLYSTYIGGNGNEDDTVQDGGVAVDNAGNAYVTGSTGSTDLPVTPGAFQPVPGGNGDVFVAKIDTMQIGPASLAYLTYIGGGANEQGKDLTIDSSGRAYVTGFTASSNFPTTNCPFPKRGTTDAFIAVLNPTGSVLDFGTYLGGSVGEVGNAISVDATGAIYLAGETSSLDFPTNQRAPQRLIGGSGASVGADAFIARVSEFGTCADLRITITDSPDPVDTGANLTYTITVTNLGPTAAFEPEVKDDLPFNASFVSCSSNGVCFQSGADVIYQFPSIAAGATETMSLVVQPVCTSGNATITNLAQVKSLTSDPVPANNSAQVLTAAKNPPPAVFCPANQTVTTASPTATLVDYPSATATDNCPGVTTSCTPASGSAFPIGTTTVTCTATDSAGLKANCSFSVTVNLNRPPVASPQDVSTTEDTSILITLTATDADNDALIFTVDMTPAHGSLGPIVGNQVTYTPAPNYHGTDTFTFKANDGTADSNIAAVNIVVTPVNDNPVARDDQSTTPEDQQVTVDVLTNDDDVENNALTITSITQGSNGAVTTDGLLVVYMPNANFFGSDTFTYTISDGNGGTATATVMIAVTAVNDGPVANDDDATVLEDTPMTIDVLTNDTDVDGNTLSIVSFTQGANGGVAADGSELRYSPNANFNGSDSFSYTISDGNGGTDSATVNIVVTPVNDAPVATDGGVATDEDAAVEITLVATDIDSPALSYTIVDQPQHGTLGAIVNNNVTYTPLPHYTGPDAFTFQASDGQLSSNSATIAITVIPVNAPPLLANIGDRVTSEGSSLGFTLMAMDPDNDTPLIFSAAGLPAGAMLDPMSGVFSWTPMFQQAGVYMVKFTVTDPGGLSDEETITITVLETPDPDQNRAPDCSSAHPSVTEIWPPNHKKEFLVGILGVTDPDNDKVLITVKRILQDEPTNTLGDGNTAIDGGGIGTSRPWVRAERTGNPKIPGNGRIYEIVFEGSDGNGGVCTGSVRLGVPHDQGKGPAVDDIIRYDSTVPNGPCLNCP